MKVSELRIGNIVDSTEKRHREEFITIESICMDEINYEFRGYDICRLEPINISENWLLKFGFIWSIYHQAIHKEGFDFDLNSSADGSYFLSTWKRGIHICEDIKYVHQLQNLYFALTNEELQFTS